MKKMTLFLISLACSGSFFAQTYCSPTFLNGCFNWRNQSVTIGTIDWIFDEVDCSVSDYTNLNTTVTVGTATVMSVTAGDWCGSSVWVDFDNSGTFEDSENLYHAGNGGTASNTFDFSITVPMATPNGSYRMRVIASWGSDGFTPGGNGSGGCGTDYDYGNYTDFTLNVIGNTAGINETGLGETKLVLSPNPAQNELTIQATTDVIGSVYLISDVLGNTLSTGKVTSESTSVSLEELSPGVYFVKLEGKPQSSIRFIKS